MMWYGNQGTRIQGGLRVQTSLRQYDDKKFDVPSVSVSTTYQCSVDLIYDIID